MRISASRSIGCLIVATVLLVHADFVSADDLRCSFDGEDQSWTLPSAARWDAQVGGDAPGSLLVEPTGGATALVSKAIPVKSGDFYQGIVRVRTAGTENVVDWNIAWYQGETFLSRTPGGIAPGRISHLPGQLFNAPDWTPMYIRGFVPKNADAMRVTLHVERSDARVWFDDLDLHLVDPQKLLGQIDLDAQRLDPEKLNPDDYVTIEGDDLRYKGKPLKIWSAQGNLMGLTHKDIDFEVRRYVEMGFNGFRTPIVWYEEAHDYPPGDHSYWDRLDYLLACLARHGVLVWSDILNGCRIQPERADIIDDPATADAWSQAIREYIGDREFIHIQGCLFLTWDERSQALYHDYIRRALAHRNPYTGLTYAEDPVFFCWELSNEEWWIMRVLWGQHLKLPTFLQKGLYDKWQEWLLKKYETNEALASAWDGLLDQEDLAAGTVLLLPLLGESDAGQMAATVGLNVSFEKTALGPQDFSRRRQADVIHFLTDLSIASKKRAEAVFRAQGRPGLGCRIVPLVYDTGYSGAVLPFYVHAQGDAIVPGSYSDRSTHDPQHPTFPFRSLLTEPPKINGWLCNRRVAGKPTFVYENMFFRPQKYEAEYPYELLAWAAIQDVDVIDFHYYGHPIPFPELDQPFTNHPLNYVDHSSVWRGTIMRNDTVLMGACRIAAEIFKNQYLPPADDPTTVTLGAETMWSFSGLVGARYNGAAANTVFHKGFQWRFDPEAKEDRVEGDLFSDAQHAAEPVVQPTPQIAYRWGQGIMTIDDASAAVVVGFLPESYAFDNGLMIDDIAVHYPEDMPFTDPAERYAAIGVVSTDGRPLADAESILVSAVSMSFNKGFELDLEKFAANQQYGLALGQCSPSMGNLPILTARVSAKLRAPWLVGKRYRFVDFNRRLLAEGNIGAEGLDLPGDLPIFLIEIAGP